MDVINAIAKVRFSSARSQRVQLTHGEPLAAELLCLEPGQKRKIDSGAWCYYIVTGTATVLADGEEIHLPTGQFTSTEKDQTHQIANDAENRLVCLAVGIPS